MGIMFLRNLLDVEDSIGANMSTVWEMPLPAEKLDLRVIGLYKSQHVKNDCMSPGQSHYVITWLG